MSGCVAGPGPRVSTAAYHFGPERRLVHLVEQLVKVDACKERVADNLFAIVLATSEALRAVAAQELLRQIISSSNG